MNERPPMFVHRLKLRPPQPLPTWIERPNVETRLGATTRVFSIVAGPGYGKTVLAARLFDMHRGPKLWYSLDATDADLAVFAAHLETMIRSLEAVRPFPGETWRLGSPKEVGSLFAELLGDVEPAPLVVFDDVHALEGSRSLAALAELVERAARADAAFVLTGRSMPLALHGVAAAARLATAGAADLAFDEEESHRYLTRATTLGDDPATLKRLARRAEGWPAGLALVASTATAASGPDDPAAHGARDEETRRLLFDYLAAEVLAGLDGRDRAFLLETSILDELDGEACDAVTQAGEAARLLPELAARGLFVARRSDDAYTVHQLFAEFLRHTLARERTPDEIAILHRRAAATCSRRGDQPGEIAHLLAAGDSERAARALESAALAMLSSGLLARVESFLQRIGRERIESSPTLLIALGRLEQLRGDWDRALASLEAAMRIARERERYDDLAEAIRISSPILAARGEFVRLLALLERTLALGSRLSEASRNALSVTLGGVLLESNRFDEALAVYREIMPAVVTRGDLPLQGMVLHNTAGALVRRGDPYGGLAMYERALKVKRSAGQRVSSLLTLGSLIFVLRLVGDLDEAERFAQKLLEDARDIGNANILAHAHENEGSIKLLRGDLAGATRAFRDGQRACDPADVLVLPDILHGLGQAALGLGNFAEADEHCAKAFALMRDAGRRQHVASVLVTRVSCAMAERAYERAYALAVEALGEAAEGPDAVLTASTNLDLAAALVRLAPLLEAPTRDEADRLAAAAAATAVALLHQRDYRFLLRTKARAFAALRDALRRWKIGQGLVPEEIPAQDSLRVELLGGLRVYSGAGEIPADAWKRRKARDIFAYLVSLGGRSVTRARLVDLYWPQLDADAAHDNLRVTISAIRKAVGDVVKFESNGYRFVAPPGAAVDIASFDESIEGARHALARGALDEARRAYAAAAELYRGEFLEGMEDGGWQWRERERLRASCLEALRWLAADPGADSSARQLVLDRLLEIAPFDLDAVRARLDLMAGDRRMAEARRDYEDWRARYRSVVGADPPDVWQPPEDAPDSDGVREMSQSRPYARKASTVSSGMARA
jgi:ATP/maltotriose-dependent transcriptional regulator MalT/DNA-binding SARP family transcriptional activator